jgi:lipid-binding SYLF domain-containing protein
MNRKLISIFASGAFLACTSIALASSNSVANLKKAAEDIELEKDQLSVKSALVEFEGAPRLDAFFENSYGIVIFPTIGKGGFGVGGAHGKGWVFREGKLTGESKVTQITIGFQVGGQAFRQIIFLEDEAAYDNFTSGNFELGAQASAVAATAGANASANTAGGANVGAGTAQAKKDYTDGMAIFTMAKGGLMYEASVGGQKFSFRPLE